MLLPTNKHYGFGGFRLKPDERRLLHLNRPIELAGKDFDVLLHLVRHANSLVSTNELIESVWGSGSVIHHGNVTNHIAKIRKALGCDPQHPSYIRTVHAKRGYVFIAPVEQIDADVDDDSVKRIGSASAAQHPFGFDVSAHIFVPVFLGANAFNEFDGPTKHTPWIEYKEHWSDNARFCVLPSGIGVWHLSISEKFDSLIDVAARRKEIYDRIFQKRNLFLNVFTDELAARLAEEENDPMRFSLGKPGYAYSLMVFEPANRKHPEMIRHVLEILASPQSLETKLESGQEFERVRRLEREFLERGVNSLDVREFGMAGEDVGFASWEGASYCSLNVPNQPVDALIEFQIAVHALWWQSKCLADAFVAGSDPESSDLKSFIPELKRQFSILKTIDPKETTSQRTMAEAVLKVNRVEQIVEETLNLYS